MELLLLCKCGAVLNTDPAHFLSCKLLKRTIVTAKHDMIVRQIASFVRSAGGSVFIEPKYLEGERADAQIYFTSDISLMDAQITHQRSICNFDKYRIHSLAQRDLEKLLNTPSMTSRPRRKWFLLSLCYGNIWRTW